MSLLQRLFGSAEPDPKLKLVPLYQQIVAKARLPHWYIEGGVPDSVDGRFDMVAAILTLILLRLEGHSPSAADMAYLTELFVDDMDGQLREFGIGDMIVGKHIGKIMGAVGGRLGAFRDALADQAKLDDVIVRNIYRSENADPVAVTHVRRELLEVRQALAAQPPEVIVKGTAIW